MLQSMGSQRVGHDLETEQQQQHSLFCNVLSLNEWEGVIPLKIRALRTVYPVYFRL